MLADVVWFLFFSLRSIFSLRSGQVVHGALEPYCLPDSDVASQGRFHRRQRLSTTDVAALANLLNAAVEAVNPGGYQSGQVCAPTGNCDLLAMLVAGRLLPAHEYPRMPVQNSRGSPAKGLFTSIKPGTFHLNPWGSERACQ